MRAQTDSYDLILVGASFASSFFLLEYLRRRPDTRVLVLESGEMLTHGFTRTVRRLEGFGREPVGSCD